MSGKRKGLSMEEKRQRLNAVFYEKCEFLSLKEVEKFGIKEKGLPPMQVKEILQSLVDDDMVKCEKIGTSNYYWSFPRGCDCLRDLAGLPIHSEAAETRKRKLAEVESEIQSSASKITVLNSQLNTMLTGREESAERDSIIKTIAVKEASVTKLEAELNKYKDCDPELLKKKACDSEVALEAANRWTDNLFSILKWCTDRNSGITQTQIMTQFEIPHDLDYLPLGI